jgi:hypothetical protein
MWQNGIIGGIGSANSGTCGVHHGGCDSWSAVLIITRMRHIRRDFVASTGIYQ